MPIYLYKCEKCGNIIERRVPVSERHKQFCEICEQHLKKLPSEPGIKFVGGGFYSTDSKPDNEQ